MLFVQHFALQTGLGSQSLSAFGQLRRWEFVRGLIRHIPRVVGCLAKDLTAFDAPPHGAQFGLVLLDNRKRLNLPGLISIRVVFVPPKTVGPHDRSFGDRLSALFGVQPGDARAAENRRHRRGSGSAGPAQ